MARLFTCGFEEDELTSNGTMWTGVSANTTTDETTPHSGSHCLNTPATATGVRRDLATALTSGTVYTRFYWRLVTAPSADQQILRVTSSGVTLSWDVTYLQASGTLRLNSTPTAVSADTTTAVSADTWYRIEVEHVISDTVGSVKMRLYLEDSTTLLEPEVIALASGDSLGSAVQVFFFGGPTNLGQTYRYDDIAINDVTGSFQTSWPGPGKIQLLAPDGDVTNDWEDETAGSSTYANINEIPGALDDANYNTESVTLNSTDRFTLTGLDTEVPSDATITLCDVYARIGSNQTSAANLNLKLWDEAGSATTGPNANANVSGWKILTTAEHLVYDATGKTKTSLASFDAGYTNVTDDATRPRRVAALWVNVEWTEAAGWGPLLGGEINRLVRA